MDILAVNGSMIYHLSVAYSYECALIYYSIIFLAAMTYPLGWYYHNKKDYWKSTALHIVLHLLADTANIILYSSSLQNTSINN